MISFIYGKVLKKLAEDQYSAIKAVSTISNTKSIQLLPWGCIDLTLGYGSMYFVEYLHMLRFYCVRQKSKACSVFVSNVFLYRPRD